MTRACRRPSHLSGGPPQLVGRLTYSETERKLARSVLDRCFVLWASLHGAEYDFDDCRMRLAERLGWSRGSCHDLDELLCQSAEVVEGSTIPWVDLRLLAIDVYLECNDGFAVELEELERRSKDEVVNDALFSSGACRLCTSGVPGSPAQHRELAWWALVGKLTFEQMGA